MKNLPRELTEKAQAEFYQKNDDNGSSIGGVAVTPAYSIQSVDEIMKIVDEARKPAPVARMIPGFGITTDVDDGPPPKGVPKAEKVDGEDDDDDDGNDDDDEYDKAVKQVHASREFHIV